MNVARFLVREWIYISKWIAGIGSSAVLLLGCTAGIQTGSLNSNFEGILSAKAISPTAVSLSWTKHDAVSEYEIYESSSSTVLQKTIFDNVTIENLQPNTKYTFKVVGTSGGERQGLQKEIAVTTWARFSGIKEILNPATGVIQASWDYDQQPLNYLVFVGVDETPTANSTSNWTLPTASPVAKTYNLTNVLPAKTYYVSVSVKYREGETEIISKTLSLTSETTFTTPTYSMPAISIGSLPFVNISITPDATHQTTGFKTQAFWNGNAVSDPLQGEGTLVFSASAGLPIGKVENISLKFEYGTGAAYESKTVSGLSTYIKGIPSFFEKPPTTSIPQGASYYGQALANGDFNCDGAMDLAVGIPKMSLLQYGVTNPGAGAVIIYYSKKIGDRYVLQTALTPVLAPALRGVDPQVITMDDFLDNMEFGYSLAAGNLNGDKLGSATCDDLLVGAPGYYSSSNLRLGAAFLFFGSSQGLKTAAHMRDMPINTESCDGLVEGSTCVGVLIKPDPANIPTALTGGSAYDPYGWGTTTHPVGYWRFGHSVAFIGDFDANGYQDIAIGAPNAPWAGPVAGYGSNQGYLSSVGFVNIYVGSQFGVGKADYNGNQVREIPIFPPIPEIGMQFGWSVAGKGDVDGRNRIRLSDGRLAGGSELVIGAPGFKYADYVNSSQLKISIGTTSNNSNVTPAGGGWVVTGRSLSDATNYYGWPQKTTKVGAAFLYYGYSRASSATSTDYDNPVDRTLWWACGNRGMAPTKHFSCLANQDSYTLLFPRDPEARSFGSAVAIAGDSSRYIADATNIDEAIQLRYQNHIPDPLVPYGFYSDPNGDGYAEVIVAASASGISSVSKTNVGHLWQFFGNRLRLFTASDFYNIPGSGSPVPSTDYSINFSACTGFNVFGDKASCLPGMLRSNSLSSGTALAATQNQIAVADVTGDGLQDLVVGASGDANTGTSSGSILVFPSQKNAGLTSSLKKLYGGETTANDRLGSAVTAGDFNGDYLTYSPYTDVPPTPPTVRPLADVFGSSPYDGSQIPSVGTVLGFVSNGFALPAVMSATSDGNGGTLLLKEAINSFTGYGVGDTTLVGDINGDGYDDSVGKITSYLSDGTKKVDAAIYFGSPYGLVTTNFCLNNKSTVFVSTQADSLCFPSETSVTGVTKSKMFAPQKITRPSSLNAFWYEKAIAAGDVNGDGYGDVLFASSYGPTVTIFFGAPGGLLNVIDPTFAPSSGDPQLVTTKISLASYSNSNSSTWFHPLIQKSEIVSGDFNGDGFADILIGSPSAGSQAMNPSGTTDPLAPFLRPSESGVSAGGGWNCGVGTTDPSCLAGTAVEDHGMIWVLYGSSQGYQTPAVRGLVTGDLSEGGPGTLNLLDTERLDAPQKPCSLPAAAGQAGVCEVGYLRNPVWENIAFGYSKLNHAFGANLQAMKVDKDAYDDALVGAPYYTDISCYSKVTPPERYGRIYVFYGSNRGLVASIQDDYYNWRRTGLSCPVEAYNIDPDLADPAMGIRADSKLRALSLMTSSGIKNKTLGLNSLFREMGHRFSNVGDVNGDGFEDLVVSNTNESMADGSGGSFSLGTLYLLYGPLCPMDNDPNLNDWFQQDLGDGADSKLNIQTFVAGAEPPLTPFDRKYQGAFATPGVTATCVRSNTLGIKPVPLKFYVLGSGGSDNYGSSVSSARKGKGDFNGDGVDDVLVGSHSSDITASSILSSGRGVVLFGSKLTNTPYLAVEDYPTNSISASANGQYRPFYIQPPHASNRSYFFYGNLTSGDVNNDGTVDYMITSPNHTGVSPTRGIQMGTFFLFY